MDFAPRTYWPRNLVNKPLKVWRDKKKLNISVDESYPFKFTDSFNEVAVLPTWEFLKKFNFFEDELALRPKNFTSTRITYDETFLSQDFAGKPEIVRMTMYDCGYLLIRTEDKISLWERNNEMV